MNHKYFEINAQKSNVCCKAYYRDKCAAEKAIVCCTGFAGHKDNHATEKFAEKLLSKCGNVMVVVFDWPAHGDDIRKRMTLAECCDYLELVTRELKSSFGVQQLYAYAGSFGAYLVLTYISERGNPFERIALRCPAVNMYDVLTRTIIRNDELDRIMKGKDVQVGFDRKVAVTQALLDELKANDIRQRDYLDYADNILIIHGTADEVIPFEDSRAFAENNIIELVPVEGADHRFQNPVHMSLANKIVMEYFGFR